MKKYAITSLILSFVILTFSIIAFSSTSNNVSSRLSRLTPVNETTLLSDSEIELEETLSPVTNETVTESVYNQTPSSVNADSYSLQTPNSNIIEPEKIVYITIDDGPDPISTPAFLKVLKENNIKATFFMVGSTIEKHPDLVKEIDLEGHSIGNHSYTHNYSLLYKNAENFTDEIIKTEDLIYSLTGKRVKIFRAPGGSPNIHKNELVNKLYELGYTFFDWNVTAADTSPGKVTKEIVLDNIIRQSRHIKRIIVLMHDNHKRPASLEALPEIIKWYKENGYEFGTLSPNIKPIHLIKDSQ